MGWGAIKDLVAKAAPLLGTALAGPAGGAAGALVAQALGVEAEPDAVRRAIEADPEALAKIRQIESEHEREIRRMVLEAETAQLAQINATYRAEIASNDPYVRRWRPTYGYSTAFTWSLQMLGVTFIVGWVVIDAPEKAPAVISAITTMLGTLMMLWGIALAVLGVSVSKRSQDKALAAGAGAGVKHDAGVFAGLAGILSRAGGTRPGTG